MPKPLYLLSFIILLTLACSNAPTVPDIATPAPLDTVTPLPPATQTPIPIAPPQAAPATISQADCPFETSDEITVICGYLTVPAKRNQPNGATIKLAYAVLAAPNKPRPDPILYLEGGPGISPIDSLAQAPETWSGYGYVNDRDVILLDQRGTGYSEPSLDCPEEADETLDDPTQACYDRLIKEGIDLSAYNTVESAADAADLWRALGYKQVNLFGVSYGTRLALAVMRYHPEGIRSVVLDSPYPPNQNVPDDEAKFTLNSLRRLFADCAAQPDCAEAYPDLEKVLLETVQKLNDKADSVALGDDEEESEITGDDFMGTLFQAMYDVELLPLFPRTIYEVSEGNYDAYTVLVAYTTESDETDYSSKSPHAEKPVDRSDSEGMYYAVSCNDEFQFTNFERAEAKIKADLPKALHSYFSSQSQFETCEVWGSGQAPASENEAVVSDIPTLILVGEYDPVTPPEMAQLTAKTLSQAQLFEFPGYGHSLSSDPDCPTDLITQFFDKPTQAVDATCFDETGEAEFYLPDDELDY